MARRIILLAALTCGVAVGVRAGEPDEARIRERVEQVTRSNSEAWQKIPWVASLTEARRLAEQEQVPIVLFTHDGNIETGRCSTRARDIRVDLLSNERLSDVAVGD